MRHHRWSVVLGVVVGLCTAALLAGSAIVSAESAEVCWTSVESSSGARLFHTRGAWWDREARRFRGYHIEVEEPRKLEVGTDGPEGGGPARQSP